MSMRIIDVDICSKSLSLNQRLVGDVSCVVWDAAIVLSKYIQLLTKPDGECLFRGCKILELGSGVGCVGLTAATLGAEVILTDLPDPLPLLRQNINENKVTITSQGGFATAESLSWGDTDSDIIKDVEFDYVLLADCVYYDESIDPLISTLANVNKNSEKKPVIYISQELRDTDKQRELWEKFYSKLTETFEVRKIPTDQQDSDFSSDDILVLSCTLK